MYDKTKEQYYVKHYLTLCKMISQMSFLYRAISHTKFSIKKTVLLYPIKFRIYNKFITYDTWLFIIQHDTFSKVFQLFGKS